MPRAVRVSKELLNLTAVGGRGCRPINNGSPPWNFPALSRTASTRFVTPADNSSLPLLNCSDDAGMNSDDDSDCWSGSEDEDIMTTDDSSCYTDDDMDVDAVDKIGRGNRLICLPALTSAVNYLASCKYCNRDQMENEFESFLQYCDGERDEVLHEASQMSFVDDVCHLRKKLDMRKWYEEWKQKREVKIGRIDVTDTIENIENSEIHSGKNYDWGKRLYEVRINLYILFSFCFLKLTFGYFFTEIENLTLLLFFFLFLLDANRRGSMANKRDKCLQ